MGNKALSYPQLYYLNQLFVILFQIHKGQDVSQFSYTTNNFTHLSNAYIATKSDLLKFVKHQKYKRIVLTTWLLKAFTLDLLKFDKHMKYKIRILTTLVLI